MPHMDLWKCGGSKCGGKFAYLLWQKHADLCMGWAGCFTVTQNNIYITGVTTCHVWICLGTYLHLPIQYTTNPSACDVTSECLIIPTASKRLTMFLPAEVPEAAGRCHASREVALGSRCHLQRPLHGSHHHGPGMSRLCTA